VAAQRSENWCRSGLARLCGEIKWRPFFLAFGGEETKLCGDAQIVFKAKLELAFMKLSGKVKVK
jgi:hypothetical protein